MAELFNVRLRPPSSGLTWEEVDLVPGIADSPGGRFATVLYGDTDTRPRPFPRPKDDLARYAVLATYDDYPQVVAQAHTHPQRALVCLRYDNLPWRMFELQDGDRFGRLKLPNRSLVMPAIAVPAGQRTTEGLIVWRGASDLVSSFAIKTAGLNANGDFLHRHPTDRGLTIEELLALEGQGDIALAQIVEED